MEIISIYIQNKGISHHHLHLAQTQKRAEGWEKGSSHVPRSEAISMGKGQAG